MTFFKFPKGEKVHKPSAKKILTKEEYAALLSADELVKESQTAIEKEREEEKKKGYDEGFAEGLEKWNAQLEHLEKEIKTLRSELENLVASLAMTAVKKIVGHELKTNPKTVVDIVNTALKPVTEHKKIAIYVNRQDFDAIEESRPDLKKLFEYLESLKIEVREEVEPGGCIIETEAGIINAELDNQYKALEKAFKQFVDKQKKKEEGK